MPAECQDARHHPSPLHSDSPETLLGDRDRDGRILYDHARIALSAPVIVDHDKERVVGRVLDLLTRYEDGEGTWLVARCEIDDRAPSWIKKGTPASFGYVITHNGGAATSSARSWVFAK